MSRRVGPVLLAVAVALLAGGSPALAGKQKSETALTGAQGEGDARLVARDGQRGAKLRVKVRGLAPRTEYKLLSDGMNFGALTTNRKGRGKVSFKTGDRGIGRRTRLLDYDPTGAPLVIATAAGDVVLQGELPPLATGVEPSPSASPSVSPFDGGLDDPCDVSPSPSPSVSPPCGGDGDGENDDEPSPTASASVSLGPKGDPGDPSPTASPSASASDVSPSVSDDEEVSPSEGPSLTPSDFGPSPDPTPSDPDPSDPGAPSDAPSVSPSTSPSPSGDAV